MTPADVHYGRAATMTAAHPERFVRKPPAPPALPATVWINRPNDTNKEQPAQ